MSSGGTLDQVLQDLRRLRALSPDPARAERLRSRCRAELERNRRPAASSTTNGVVRRVLAPAMVVCLGVLYLAGLVGAALQLNNLFD
jgi:hypothetical protein